MKVKKVQGTKRADGKGYYSKYIITPVPEEIVSKSGLLDKNVKARAEKNKIIIEKE